MEYFEKKITYLRGLCDGSGYPQDSKEGKIFHGILDVLDDIAFMLESYMEDDDDFDEMLYDDSEVGFPGKKITGFPVYVLPH